MVYFVQETTNYDDYESFYVTEAENFEVTDPSS
jgi:hypothetical protein